MTNRDYQSEDIQKIFEAWKEHRSVLCVQATGLGKTRLMSQIAKMVLPKRSMFLAHMTELIYQARDEFERNGIQCDIEKAELVAGTNLFNRADCVMAMVQTLKSGTVDRKRMLRFKPEDFGYLFYDESDTAITAANKAIVDYFLQGNPNLKVLGVTATPTRSDEKAMGQIFETVVEPVRDILFGIENGWLVNIEQKYVAVSGVDLSHIATSCGDLNTGQLSKEMEKEENIQGVVQPTLEYLFRQKERFLDSYPVETWGEVLGKIGNPRRAIAFAVSVVQAEMLSNIFNRVIPEISHWVCGETESGRRTQILRDFQDGRASILCNVGIATRGYNNPFVDLIVMARPTKSENFYRQCIGRGTRVLQGVVDGLGSPQERLSAIAASAKPYCLVLDIVGNSGKHSLISTADVLAGDYDEEVVERAKEKAKKSSTPVRMTELMEEEAELQRKAAERMRQIAESHKKSMVARTNYKTVDVNPFSVLGLTPARTRGWDSGRTLSDAQRGVLLKNGINPDDYGYAEGKQLLNEIFRRYDNRLARFKQINCIKKYAWVIGLNKDTFDFQKLKADDASKMIEEISTKQNWTKRTPQHA